MSRLFFVEVLVPGKPPERCPFDDDRLWIGSAGEGALRARAEAGGARHELELLPEDAGVRIESPLGASLRLFVDGLVERRAFVRWGDAILLENVRLRFVDPARPRRGKLVVPLVLAALALALLILWPAGTEGAVENSEVAPPSELYAGSAPCSAPGSGAEARARDAERSALAKQERYAFDLSDGVHALPLFREAQACFLVAGRSQDAQRAKAEESALVARLGRDFSGLRLELRAALDAGRSREALAVARKLDALLTLQGGGPYSEWLAGLRRSLEAKLSLPQKSATSSGTDR